MKNKVLYILIAIVLLWYRFYGYVGLNSYASIFNGISYLIFLFLLIYTSKEIFKKQNRLLMLLLLNTVISMSMAMMVWGESLFGVFAAFHNYFLLMVFFLLFKMRAKENEVEKALIILALIYVACWVIQVWKVPELIFGVNRDANISDTEQRGFYRFFIPTKEHMPILVLFLYEMFRRTKKIIFLILCPICFAIVILHVIRQMIFWSFLSIVLLLLYQNRKHWTKILVASMAVYGLSLFLIDNIPTLNLLFEQTMTQVNNADDDIRLQCINFYWHESISNPLTFFFGNGLGSDGELWKFTQKTMSKGYYESDIGYFALLFDFGLLGVLLYTLLFVKIFRLKVEEKYQYLKFYLLYIYGCYTFAHTLTTNIFFNMCAIYILYMSNKKIVRNNAVL